MTEPSNLSRGTYDVLRGRLSEAASELRARLKKLDAERGQVFGNIATELLATARVTTSHNGTPRDLISVGDVLLLGYNVQFGLKTEIELADVFSAFRLDGTDFHEAPLDLINDDRFVADFHELYRFYKDTRFARFFADGPNVHFVFQVGKRPGDIKTFKFVVTPDTIRYVDNRSDHEVTEPPQHAFRWKRTTRDSHRYGAHPHVSIEDRVFVETVGGDLTIKVEDNTDDGRGIYAEAVDDPDQTLDDAEIHYAIVGNLILLKMKPYREDVTRYLIFNGKTNTAMRLDEMAASCVLLPGDQGIIFPGGYYLQTGEFKRFDHGETDMRYSRTVASPNGEDFLYVFYDRGTGRYVHLRYNLIRQTVDTPLIVAGATFYDDGRMVCFKDHTTPQRHHALQIWQTPFVGENHVPDNQVDSFLYKIGNKDLVRGMAECGELLTLIDKDDDYEDLYVDLVTRSAEVLDSHFWIDRDDTFRLDEPIEKIRDAASAAVEEYEKVVRARRDTAEQTETVERAVGELVQSIERGRFESIDDFVETIAQLRVQRGHAIGLRELRFVDESVVETLEQTTAEWTERISRRCVEFLLSPGALDPYARRVEQSEEKVAEVTTVVDAKALGEEIDAAAEQLELLTETVSNLKIDDATKRTEIIESLSDVFASTNRVRSRLKARVSDLIGAEGRAEFASQMKLLDQTVAGYLDVCDTAEACDEYLTKVMVQIEELEGRFAEFDEFIVTLATRRDEIYEAFESRKVAIVERQNRRAESLSAAATRILTGINNRASSMDDSDAIAAYFAGDLMVDKVRGIIEQLGELGDSVRAGDLESRLKTIREDAMRGLKDRQDLYESGGDVIRMGPHRFAVNRQPLDLTTVVRDGALSLHITGTQFFEPMDAPPLLAAQDLWDQFGVNENASVYRGEFLATRWLDRYRATGTMPDHPSSMLVDSRGEHYAKGVHDVDAMKILETLVELESELGPLRHDPTTRTAARMWFDHVLDDDIAQRLRRWMGGYTELAQAFPDAQPAIEFRREIEHRFERDREYWSGLFPGVAPENVAAYLFDELVGDGDDPVVSNTAASAYQSLTRRAGEIAIETRDPSLGFVLARNWATAVWASEHDGNRHRADDFEPNHRDADESDATDATNETSPRSAESDTRAGDSASDTANAKPKQNAKQNASIDELAWLIYRGGVDALNVLDAESVRVVEGLVGDHPRISGGRMTVDYHELTMRLDAYRRDVVPRYEALQSSKSDIIARNRETMRLDEFKPRVLTSFVRNRLIDEVYLPIIGDNLAKQMGTAGADKRTDRMGLLLLISPPGYGKTTLMEYVANRLGIVFMKINGPAIGHGVTSLDPAEAPNAAAREEIERLNLALEMGDNVMLYLDDIQHTHPELLQKFISLCDATRKIEGVRNGKTRTYDLRGRRVAVVMAGNPYTESGDRFQVPDMLSNRADVYNLGEIIGGSAEAFEMSYLENCLTSHPVLRPLSTAPPEDARAIIRAADRDSMEGLETRANFSADQLREMFEVMRKLIRVRDAVLKVNRAYIASAAQADAYRTEPPFKLQGSYRNMNRIAEKVAAVMNDDELRGVIESAYLQESQTLTTDNEANVLKFKELMGTLTADEKDRWESIKYAYVESVRMAGMADDDAAGQLMRQLGSMRDGLESIRSVISKAIAAGDGGAGARQIETLQSLRHVVAAAGEQLSGAIASTGGQVAQLTRDREMSPPSQQVIVQHKIPRVLVDLVRGQFHLMQEWMRPLLDESIDNGRDLDRLRVEMQQLLSTYNEVQDSFDKG